MVRALRVLQERSAKAVGERLRAAIALEVERHADAPSLARAVFRATTEEVDRLTARDGFIGPDCAPGCASCCHVHVDATQPEVEVVIEHVLAKFSDAEVSELTGRMKRSAHLTPDARWDARVPCAFLASDDTCAIHAVRPLRCRAFHSCSAAVCRAAFAGRTDATPQRVPALTRIYGAAESTLDAALQQRGQGTEPVTLEAGVLRGLHSRVDGPR